MDVATRFCSKVRRGDGCWLWTAYRNASGYGVITVAGKQRLAHRVAWELTHGPIHDDACVLHHCDNPACCNPAHLFLGDRAANNADKVAKGRNVNPLAAAYQARSHCCRGHEYTESNTRMNRGYRQCRECERLHGRALYVRHRDKRIAAMRQYNQRRRAAARMGA